MNTINPGPGEDGCAWESAAEALAARAHERAVELSAKAEREWTPSIGWLLRELQTASYQLAPDALIRKVDPDPKSSYQNERIEILVRGQIFRITIEHL